MTLTQGAPLSKAGLGKQGIASRGYVDQHLPKSGRHEKDSPTRLVGQLPAPSSLWSCIVPGAQGTRPDKQGEKPGKAGSSAPTAFISSDPLD